MTEPPEVHEAALELMRRQSGLRVDREGRFWHQGTLIAHPRIQAVLAAGVDRHPRSGEFIVRIGAEWAYLEVDDAPLVVLGVEGTGGAPELRLSDGRREVLTPSSLWLGADDVLYFAARTGEMPARFSRNAHQVLMFSMELGEDGVVHWNSGGARHVLARHPPPRTVP